MADKHIIWTTDETTTVYEFEGLTLPRKDIAQRWKYLGRHSTTDKENLKVIFVDSTCSNPTNHRPFNYCTKIEWNSAEIRRKFSTQGMKINAWDKHSRAIPLGAFTQTQKVIWKSSVYRSVSDPEMGMNVSEKILCFFERRSNEITNNQITNEVEYLISKLERNSNVDKHLYGMCMYKNISHFVSDAPYVEMILEFTISPSSACKFKPLLDRFFDTVTFEIGFCYGMYKRNQLMDREEPKQPSPEIVPEHKALKLTKSLTVKRKFFIKFSSLRRQKKIEEKDEEDSVFTT